MPVALFEPGERREFSGAKHIALLLTAEALPPPLLIITPPGLVMDLPAETVPHKYDVDGKRLCKKLQILDVKDGAEV